MGSRQVSAVTKNLDSQGIPHFSLPAAPARFRPFPADLFDDHPNARDVEIVRARPYVDEAGAEIGEIVPEYPTK